jgi:uncharacterized membrane protein YhaH (DUF805 family)
MMANVLSYYLDPSGRLNRGPFWIAGIVLAVVQGTLPAWITPNISYGKPTLVDIQAAAQAGDVPRLGALLMQGHQWSGWAELVVSVIFAYPTYALCVKRRHDRDNSGLDLLVFMAFSVALSLVWALGLSASPVVAQNAMTIQTATWYWPVLIVFIVYAIYIFVVLGFLKGTLGPNRYGPDPLQVAPKAMRAAGTT